MRGRVKQAISREAKVLLSIVGIFLMCMAYEVLAYRQHQENANDTTIPQFGQLVDGFIEACTPKEDTLKEAFGVEDKREKTFWEKVESTWFYQDATATYSRLLKGLFWGCLFSVILGVLMGCYEGVASFFLPTMSFLSKVPGTAMLAVFFVLAKKGEVMFTAMISFGVLPTLTQAIYFSAKDDIHEEEVNKAYSLGATNFEVIWNVVIPQIMPKIMENVRLQIGPAMVYLIAAEMLMSQVGMGYQIRVQQRMLHMAVVYDYIIVLGASGLLMDRAMLYLRRWLCPWYEPEE